MNHVLQSLYINGAGLHSRIRANLRPPSPCQSSTTGGSRRKSSPRNLQRCHVALATHEEDLDEEYDSADDEICGIDFVTLQPIRGADCRRLRLEEEKMQAQRAHAVAAKAESDAQLQKRSQDGYDFFGRWQSSKPSSFSDEGKQTSSSSSSSSSSNSTSTAANSSASTILQPRFHVEPSSSSSSASSSAAAAATAGSRIEAEDEAPNFLRPAYRASPLLAEFQRQREKSTTARILFLDEGGEFRAALGAALLTHMLTRLRTALDVTVEYGSLGPLPGFNGGKPSAELLHTAAFMGIPLLHTDNSTPAVKQFEEVVDAVRYDLILVMDRFDHQEVLREVAILDAINPGGNYSGRVRLLGPFGMAARRATPPQVVQDIVDPLYHNQMDSSGRQTALQAAAMELSFSCRGLATFLLDLQARCHDSLTLRAALAQSLRCPMLAGELPSQRDRSGGQNVSKDDEFTVRAVNGQRQVMRRPSKPRGYWKSIENVDAELRQWMKARRLERLPLQKELRASGASSLASAVDAHGGLSAFSVRLGVAMASRRPNGYWDNFENLQKALSAYVKPVSNSNNKKKNNSSSKRDGDEKMAVVAMMMPSVQELVRAGRSDLLGAISDHGGVVAVAARLGVNVRRGSGWDEAKILQELQSIARSGKISVGGALPTKDQLFRADRSDLVSAVNKLGGFAYFQELDRSSSSKNSSSSSSNTNSSSGDILPFQSGGKYREKASVRRIPLVEKVSQQVAAWMAANGHSNQLPMRSELEACGSADVWIAIQRCGGGRRVAEHMGLEWVETRGRRRRKEGENEAVMVTAVDEVDLKADVNILDAYEEFVFV